MDVLISAQLEVQRSRLLRLVKKLGILCLILSPIAIIAVFTDIAVGPYLPYNLSVFKVFLAMVSSPSHIKPV